MIRHCNFCGNEHEKLLYKDYPHLVLCDKCGLVYTKAQMDVEAMKEFYHDDYFVSTNSVKKGYDDYFTAKRDICNTFSKRMDMIEKYATYPGKLLDVGCAAGFFLEVARGRGWDVHGVDISEVCANFAKKTSGINVKTGLFVNTSFEENSFDLIAMWDYLEHSITPKEDIQHAWNLLKENGLLVIATPDISSIPARVCRTNWIGIKLEEHFYYFTREVLSKALKNVGFDMLKVGYIGKHISCDMVADRLRYYNLFLSRTIGKLLKKMKFSFYCNPFDIMLLIAKKKTKNNKQNNS